MCGIVGIWNFNNIYPPVNQDLLDQMRDTMIHRGPDGGRSWISDDRRVGLGFRRLAILDLSESAMQPMCNEDGTVWVVFNGEIYNYAEIRAELEHRGGHIWKTHHSDTEVILHSYEEWGIECVDRFRGMFAIGIWDARQRLVFLIRDRIGIKPLYYTIQEGRLIFASEIKAILADTTVRRSVNEEAFFHYLSFLSTPAPQTLFEGINKIPSGCWLRIDSSGQSILKRYWEVWEHTQPMLNISENEIAERLLAELKISVRLRKISDVPVGVFLSGGIDSSTNAVLFSEGESQPVKTFSIGYTGEYKSYKNEFEYARKVARKIGADHHELVINQEDLISFLPHMVRLQDEPIGDPVCVPVYYVSKLAREHGVIVCQVGEGADELFCGYPWWKFAIQMQNFGYLDRSGVFSRLGIQALSFLGKSYSLQSEYLRRISNHLPVFWGGAEAFSEVEKMSILSPRLRKKFLLYSSWEAISDIWNRYQTGAWEKAPLNWMTFVDINYRLPELLLMRVDKMSMGVGLEARVPYLDHEFVELGLSIPSDVRYINGKLKHILKIAIRDLIPSEILKRPKQGFQVPMYEWFFGNLGNQARTQISSFCKEVDFLDVQGINALFDHRRYNQIWNIFNFCLWWKEFMS